MVTILLFTEKQLERFYSLRSALNDDLPDDVLIHTHNSAATVRLAPGATAWCGLEQLAMVCGPPRRLPIRLN